MQKKKTSWFNRLFWTKANTDADTLVYISDGVEIYASLRGQADKDRARALLKVVLEDSDYDYDMGLTD